MSDAAKSDAAKPNPKKSDAAKPDAAKAGVEMVDAAPQPKATIGWVTLLIAAIFGLVFAYNVWEAIAPMVALPSFYDQIGLKQSDVPWWLLAVGLAIPIIVFFAAFFIGLRRSVFAKALIYILGIVVVAALSLGVVALELVIRNGLLAALPPAV